MARRFDRDSKYNSIGSSGVSTDAFEFMDTNSANTCDSWNCGPGAKKTEVAAKGDKKEHVKPVETGIYEFEPTGSHKSKAAAGKDKFVSDSAPLNEVAPRSKSVKNTRK